MTGGMTQTKNRYDSDVNSRKKSKNGNYNPVNAGGL